MPNEKFPTVEQAIKRLERLGNDGFIVSIVYGRCGNSGAQYSVDVLNRKGQTFGIPFAATSIQLAVHIAEHEIHERGWDKQS